MMAESNYNYKNQQYIQLTMELQLQLLIHDKNQQGSLLEKTGKNLTFVASVGGA
jgi:hypothetical protein